MVRSNQSSRFIMEKYFCDCVNVTLNVIVRTKKKVEGQSLIQLKSENELEIIDPFFKLTLLEVELAISGIEVSQEVLTVQRCYDDWLVTCCLNCGRDTFATHSSKGLERVLIVGQLNNGSSAFDEIIQSSNYSKTFKIKLPDKESPWPVPSTHPKESYRITEKVVQAFVKKSIAAEQEAMNDRIRIFTSKQHQAFHDFKVKANIDKETVIKTLRRFDDLDMNDAMFDSIIQESHFGNPFSEERDQCTDLLKIRGRSIPIKTFDVADHSTSAAKSLPMHRFSHEKKTKHHSPVRTRAHSSDDTLFDIEGFHQNQSCEPFFESDDESSGETASLESSGGYTSQLSSRGLSAGDRVYATSVPVAIQIFDNKRHSYDPEEPELDDPSPSPSHIADSIKALAKSMQDSTAMFGELPRPRLNTMPYSLR